MANAQRGYVEVELDKTRTFRFTLNALEEVEERLGFDLAEMEGKKLKIKEIKVIMWAGLIHEDPELTLDDVGAMIDMENLSYVQEKMGKAFKAANSKK